LLRNQRLERRENRDDRRQGFQEPLEQLAVAEFEGFGFQRGVQVAGEYLLRGQRGVFDGTGSVEAAEG